MFSENGLADYEHDIKDSHKGLFPLGRTITFASARKFVFVLHVVGIVFGLVFLIHGPAVFLFGAMYAFGLLYNQTNKKSSIAGVFIAINFGLIPYLSYYAITFNFVNPILIAISAYGMLQVFFQNAISGAMKDIDSDRRNLLKILGVEVHNYTDGTPFLRIPKKASRFALLVKGLGFIPLFLVFSFQPPSYALPVQGVSTFFFTMGLFVVNEMFKGADSRHAGVYDNRKMVRKIVFVEITTYFAMFTALVPFIGVFPVVALVAWGLAWLMFWNHVLWDSWLSPRV